ncbi:MAG: penicillin acylase family protein, partial [Deltaproteobacteria bacterium]
EVAVRHVEHFEPERHPMVAVLNMMRATSLAEYRAALNEWMSPTVNALYAGVDRGDTGPGHIAYHALFGMPERVRNVVQGLDLTGRIPFDGSTRANDWRSIRGLDWHPFVIDPPEGYLFSGNHLPVGSWYDDVVGYTGLAGNGDSLRSLRLRYLFDRALGTSAAVTPRTIHAFHFDAGGTHVELLADVLEALLASGTISIPAANDFGVTRNEMAGKTLAALRLWLASGAQIENSNPWFPITRRAGPRMIQQSRYGANPEFSCTYNEAAGGVAFAL